MELLLSLTTWMNMEDHLLNTVSQAQQGILNEFIDTGLPSSHSQRGKWGLAGEGEGEMWGWVIYPSNVRNLRQGE